MKEIKEFFKTIKNWWGNPRLKGVVQLVFWIIFFVIVALMFRSGKSSDEIKRKDNTNNSNEVISYEYEYEYKDDTSVISISGTHYDSKERFTIDNDKFYFIDGKYYNELTNTEITLNYAVGEWSYKSIKNITDHNSYLNVTKYKSGDSKYEYNIDSTVYNNYYKSSYSNNIIISITKNSNDIITDATINYGFGIVTIKYTNINEIDSLDINAN